MEVETAGKDVGAGEPFERETGAVGAATHGNHHGGYAHVFHGLFGKVDNVHDRLYLLAHVVVLVFDFEAGTVGELPVDFPHEVLKLLLAALETVAVVVADNVAERGLLDAAFARNEVVEAFITLGVFGSFPAGEHDGVLYGDTQ